MLSVLVHFGKNYTGTSVNKRICLNIVFPTIQMKGQEKTLTFEGFRINTKTQQSPKLLVYCGL